MCHCYLPLFVLKLVLHNVSDEYSLISLNTTEQVLRSSKISSCVFLYQEPKNKNQLQDLTIGVQELEKGATGLHSSTAAIQAALFLLSVVVGPGNHDC